MPSIFNPLTNRYQEVDDSTAALIGDQSAYAPPPSLAYSAPTPEQEFLEFLRTPRTAPIDPVEQEVQWADYGKSIMAGGANIVAGLGWLTDRIDGDTGIGEAIRNLGNDAVDYWNDSLSEAAKEELAKEFIRKTEDGSGLFGYEWGDASLSTIGLLGAQSLLGTAAGAGVGAGITKVLQVFGNPIGRGVLVNSVKAGNEAAKKLATAGSAEVAGLTRVVQQGAAASKKLRVIDRILGAAGFGAGEGAVGGMSAGVNVENEIMKLPLEQLMESPRFQQIYESSAGLMDEDKRLDYTRTTLAREASSVAGFQAGLTTALLGAPMGAYFGPLFSKVATGRAGSIIKGAAGEAAQEFFQGGAEQLLSNRKLRQVGSDVGLWENVLNAAVGGAAAGAPLGGVMATAGPTDQQVADAEKRQKLTVDGVNYTRLAEMAAEAKQAGATDEEILPIVQQARQRGQLPQALAKLRQLREAKLADGTSGRRETTEPVVDGPVATPEDLAAVAQDAATSPLNERSEPTEAQIEAGNYRKPRVKLPHLPEIRIENPMGSKRRGKRPDGTEWESELVGVHYGYFTRTAGADNQEDGTPREGVDVFVGPNATDATLPVFVIDQKNSDGSFDEHKVMVGFATEDEARQTYLAQYEEGWDSLGAITRMSPDALTAFLADEERTSRPVAYQPQVPATLAETREPIQMRDIETDTAVTATGREVPVRYAVLEASDLIASQTDEGRVNPDYPAELQPRDRSRGVSQQQVQDIARKLNPRLLDRSPRASDGAPIIARNGVVESGNGRVLAIRRAYTEGGAEGYRQYLAEQGYPVEGMKQPVLVRVREGELGPAERAAFTREANERDTLGMSATERAMADAAAIPDGLLELYRGGDVDAAANRDFVRAFIDKVAGKNEQAGMIAADGAMSQEAIRRIEGALLAKAYGDADLVATLTESADTSIRAIGGALMDVAAGWAQMRAEAAVGRIDPAMDQTAQLLEAVRLVQRARREGRSVAELVGQQDLLSGTGMSVVSEAFLRLMFRNTLTWTRPAGRDKIADGLRYYLDQAKRALPGVDLLGEATPEPERILEVAQERQYGTEAEQPGLFAQPPRGAVEGSTSGDRAVSGTTAPREPEAEGTGAQGSSAEAVAGRTYEPPTTDVREPAPVSAPEQGDLFAAPELSPEEQRAEARANYRVLVRQEETGTVTVGLDTVRTPEDAAHVLAPFRRHAQETMLAIVTDQDDRILSVIRHSKGTVDGTPVYPGYFTGAILSIPGAAHVWFGHNHPSGRSQESDADRIITEKLHNLLQGSDIEVRGHVVVTAGGKMAAMGPSGQPLTRGQDIKPAPRRKSVSVTERILRGQPRTESVTTPTQLAAAFRRAGSEEGVLLLDNQHRPLGFVMMDAHEMRELRADNRSARLLIAINYTNANAIAVYTHNHLPAVAANLQKFANAATVRALDYLHGENFIQAGFPFAAGDAFMSRTPAANEQLELTATLQQRLRDATGSDLARKAANDFVGRPLTNIETGQVASVSKISLGKMTSGSAVRNSFSPQAHMLAVANIDHLFEIATKQETRADRDESPAFIAWHQFDAPMPFGDAIVRVKMLVKELAQKEQGSRIYTLSAVEIERASVNRGDSIDPENRTRLPTPPAGSDDRFAQLVRAVKAGTPPLSRSGEAMGFYSALTRAAENLKQERGQPGQMLAVFKNQPGVKAEELEWTGLGEYLKTRKGLVTRQEIVDFLAAHGVQVEEVTGAVPDVDYGSDFKWTEYDRDEDGNRRFDVIPDAGETSFEVTIDEDGGHISIFVTNTGESIPIEAEPTADLEAIAADAVRNIFGRVERELAAENSADAYYEKYTLPGGENYREVLLKLPSTTADDLAMQKFGKPLADLTQSQRVSIVQERYAQEYHDPHFAEPNIIAHLRLTDRIGTDGGRILFIEELQSDWHQQGRRKGYRVDQPKLEDAKEFFGITDADWAAMDAAQRASYLAEMQSDEPHVRAGKLEQVPDAPFKGNAWAELAIKRVIRMAAERGYDAVAWTTGEQQNERYNLRKQVDTIQVVSVPVSGEGMLLVAASRDGNQVVKNTVHELKLDSVIGKELAERIMQQPADPLTGQRILKGEQLEVGGEGMKGFYDRTLPNLFKKVARKLERTASTATVEIPIFAGGTGAITVHSLEITDAMREGAMGGQPLFRTGRGRGLKAARVEERLGEAISAVSPLLTVRVVQSVDELPGNAMPDDVEGAYFNRGAVFLVADNLSAERVEQVFRHEVFGHAAMERHPDFPKWVKQIENAKRLKGGTIAKLAAEVASRQGVLDPTTEAKEIIALMAERGVNNSLLDRIIAAFRQFFRSVGLLRNVSEAEIRAWLAKGARRFMSEADEATPADNSDAAPQRAAALFARRAPGATLTAESTDEEFLAAINAAMDPPNNDTQLKRFLDEAIFRFQDKFNYLHKAQQAAARERGLDQLPEAEDAYLAELRYHGMAGAAIEDFQRDHVDPLVEAISKSGLNVEDVEAYLHARHAPEANEQLKRINPDRPNNDALSGTSDAEAARSIERFRDAGKLQQLEEIAARVDAITQAQRDLMVEAGLESAETIKQWEATYQYYVPLHREGFDGRSEGRGRGFSITGRQKGRAGSQRAVAHILAQVVSQHEATIVRAEKNKVAQALFEFATNNPNPDLYEVDQVEFQPSFGSDGLVTYRPQKSFQLADNVVVAKVDGQNHTIAFNQRNHQARRIAHAMKDLGAGHSGPILNVLTKVMRYLALVNTGANPEFIISNFPRDVQTALYNISDTDADKLKWKIIKDVGKAWRGIRAFQQRKHHPWAEHFDAFRKAGAQTGWLGLYSDIADRQAALVKRIEELNGDSSLLKIKIGLRTVVGFIDRENTAVENAIRLSAFVHARQAGMTEGQAARIAKELTVNFNRKGDYGQVVNAMYLFYNASIQGSARIIAAASRSPKVRKFIGATVVLAMFLDILNRALAGDDDDDRNRYDKIPDYVKERNLIIMLPNGHGDYIKIPLPWGYNVFHVLGQVMGEALTKRNFKATEGAFRVADAVTGAFNPIGSEASLTQMISPTLTDPIVQWSENKDWAGRPLRPQDNPFDVDKPDSQQYWNSVRAPSRWITEQLNELTGGSEVRPGAVDISPEWIDLLIDTFTGGAGRFVSDSLSTPIKAIQGDDIESYEIPLLRKVYGRPGVGTLYEDYYRNADAVRITEKEARHFTRTGNRRALDELRRERPGEYALIGVRRNIDNQLRKLRQRRNKVEASKVSEGLKRTQLAKTNEQIEELMNRFNRLYNQRVGE